MKRRTIWSVSGPRTPAAVLAAEVEIHGDSDSVELVVTEGPRVMLSIQEDGSFEVVIRKNGYSVKFAGDVPEGDGEFVRCVLSPQ